MTKSKPPPRLNRTPRSSRKRRREHAGQSSQVRIIGGKWRGRKLPFTPLPGLRPTLGRTRETLFNWLRGSLHDCSCLDLFAGSGALGFEALSQGAAQVTFVEQHRQTAQQIQRNLDALHSTERSVASQVIISDALEFLPNHPSGYQVVFLDPPFEDPDLLVKCLGLLEANADLKFVYLETDRLAILEPVLATTRFRLKKQTRAGEAHGLLIVPD
ncbi:MAG: 16S rRNA (guanine(966)-N(2))-methyltransferase RsmD [Pseudomonadota bacterium]